MLGYHEKEVDEMRCEIYPIKELKDYRYVVILSRYQGELLLSRHRQRTTWEAQGGHIEAGESPMEAARRELFEESGAIRFTIAPLCDYRARAGDEISWSSGVVFIADIFELGPLPYSEMAETRGFQQLPRRLTYPEILPKLLEYLQSVHPDFVPMIQ